MESRSQKLGARMDKLAAARNSAWLLTALGGSGRTRRDQGIGPILVFLLASGFWVHVLYSWNRLNTRQPLVPPNPKLLDSA
jgi:hypothetical protein